MACYDAAEAVGAERVVATTGGKLAEHARRDGVPVIGMPAGLQPRAAVGYTFAIAAEVAALVGAGAAIRTEIDSSAAHLEAAEPALLDRAAELARADRRLGSADLRLRADRAGRPTAGSARSTRTRRCLPSRTSCPRSTTTRSSAGSGAAAGAYTAIFLEDAISTRASASGSS